MQMNERPRGMRLVAIDASGRDGLAVGGQTSAGGAPNEKGKGRHAVHIDSGRC